MVMDRTRELVRNLETLANEIVTDPDKLREFGKKWMNGFHSYSMGNTLLIWWQRPEATLCAGYTDWIVKHHRQVRLNEHGLSILAPIFFKKAEENEKEEVEEKQVRWFKVVKTFDISQTDGEPIELGCSDLITGGDLKLADLAKMFPYELRLSNGISNGSTDGKVITISERDNEVAMVATYTHELAHTMLHFPREKDITDREIRELEAEAVSYLVCSCVGIDHKMAGFYIGNWKGDKTKLGLSGQRILKTAEAILRTIDKRSE